MVTKGSDPALTTQTTKESGFQVTACICGAHYLKIQDNILKENPAHIPKHAIWAVG